MDVTSLYVRASNESSWTLLTKSTDNEGIDNDYYWELDGRIVLVSSEYFDDASDRFAKVNFVYGSMDIPELAQQASYAYVGMMLNLREDWRYRSYELIKGLGTPNPYYIV